MAGRKSKICMEHLPFNLTFIFKSHLAFVGSDLWCDLQLRRIGRSAYFTLVLVSVKWKIHHCFESIPLSEIRINHRPRRHHEPAGRRRSLHGNASQPIIAAVHFTAAARSLGSLLDDYLGEERLHTGDSAQVPAIQCAHLP